MKRIASILLVVALFLIGLWCLNFKQPVKTNSIPVMDIRGINGIKIGGMQLKGKVIALLDDGYVYMPNDIPKDETEVYRYYFSGNKTVKIGTIPKSVRYSENAVIKDGHLYSLCVANPHSYDVRDTLNVLQIDLAQNKLEFTWVGNTDWIRPHYFSLSICEDALSETGYSVYIFRQHGSDTIFLKYDPETQTTQTLSSGVMNYLQKSGVTLKAFDISGNTLNVLGLDATKNLNIYSCPFTPFSKYSGENETYNDMKCINANAAFDTFDDRNREVFEFRIILDYAYIDREKTIFGRVNDGKLENAMDTNNMFYKANDGGVGADNTTVFYEYGGNNIYYFDANAENGEKIKKAKFSCFWGGYSIETIRKSPDDHLLIIMQNSQCDHYRCYYIKRSDLKFENVSS